MTQKNAIGQLDKNPRDSNPKSFLLYQLDVAALKTQLATAPLRNNGQASSLVIPMPDAEGNMLHFRVYKAPVIHAGLFAKYPSIQSYVGQCIEQPGSTMRFSVTLFGLHAMTLTAGHGTWYIDPYTRNAQYYMVYKRSDLQTNKTFTCFTGDLNNDAQFVAHSAKAKLAPQDMGSFRTYRLAIAATVEYSAFQIEQAGLEDGTYDQKMEAVLSAIGVTITRVNSMFERDLSVSLELVPNNELVVFIDSDALNNDDAGALLNEGNDVIYAAIGADNFDMGHSFGTGGGGLAAGAPCSDFKAGAMTGISSPVGDSFDIDFVAHEMAHQFGAGHTFNAECGGNRSDELAYEPGGGTTILAYAGVCDPVIQYHSDVQFHAISIQQMRSRINGESNCVALVATGNVPPVANAGADYVIPKGTAFILEGTGTDANGDALTYDWEQMNNEISVQPPVPTAVGGPNYRSLPISDSPNRFMPRIEDVINGNLFPEWEVTPTVARDLDFALTVRDNNINGGEATTDYMHIDVAGAAGPFVITSPNNAAMWQAATNKTVTWNVAGTTENNVNTPYVDIFLSTDGGFTYPIQLASAVPNDGSQSILVPNTPGSCRIMVRGHDNIFYDISNNNFTITATESTFIATVSGEQTVSACKGATVSYTLNYETINGFTGTTTFSASGNPAGSVVSFSPDSMTANGAVVFTVNTTTASPPGLYAITVAMTSGSVTKNLQVFLNLLSTDFAQLQLLTPENGTNTLPTAVTLDWSTDVIAVTYHLQVAPDAAFANIITDVVTTTSEYALTGLTESTHYYWRVMAANQGCEGNYSESGDFITGDAFCIEYSSADVPLEISGGDPATTLSTLEVDADFTLQDIQVSMDVSHSWLSDVVATLISPAGTSVFLFGNQCGDHDNANITFDDDAAAITCQDGPVALQGTFAPQEALGQLIGESVNGTWTLQVQDTEGGDGGAVNHWSITICGLQEATAGVLTNKSVNFTVYPNPNSGSFNVQFTATGKPAAISVYDMRGRKLYGQSTTAAPGLFTQQIQIEAQAGIYLVTIEQGGRKSTKKIVVQ